MALTGTLDNPPADSSLLNLDPTDVQLYAQDTWRPVFARLRREAPVFYFPDSRYGAYWAITSHEHITLVESRPDIFSSDSKHGGISIVDLDFKNFISSDRPRHTEQRRVVAPAVRSPSELARMAESIRARTAQVLDSLPRDKEFNWVDRVAIELTTQMLAILFDFPWDERRQLTEWSFWSRNVEAAKDPELKKVRDQHLANMTNYFSKVWEERRAKPPSNDLISLMAHSEAMGNMDWEERLGNLALLIVGGNDTTRNSMSGMVLAFNLYPDEREKIQRNPALLETAVPELVRWQTPVISMRRTCIVDTELGGQKIKSGDKVVMWYISGNRDETIFDKPEAFIADRANARQHISFGFGVHRCLGSRLAELQIKILLEEMMARKMRVEITGETVRPATLAGHGFDHIPVRLRFGE